MKNKIVSVIDKQSTYSAYSIKEDIKRFFPDMQVDEEIYTLIQSIDHKIKNGLISPGTLTNSNKSPDIGVFSLPDDKESLLNILEAVNNLRIDKLILVSDENKSSDNGASLIQVISSTKSIPFALTDIANTLKDRSANFYLLSDISSNEEFSDSVQRYINALAKSGTYSEHNYKFVPIPDQTYQKVMTADQAKQLIGKTNSSSSLKHDIELAHIRKPIEVSQAENKLFEETLNTSKAQVKHLLEMESMYNGSRFIPKTMYAVSGAAIFGLLFLPLGPFAPLAAFAGAVLFSKLYDNIFPKTEIQSLPEAVKNLENNITPQETQEAIEKLQEMVNSNEESTITRIAQTNINNLSNMPRQTVIVASKNKNKVELIKRRFEQANTVNVISLLDLPESDQPLELGTSYQENALIKARSIADNYPGCYIIAEDSGIEVDHLEGAPGIYTRRFVSSHNSRDIVDKIINELDGVPKHRRGISAKGSMAIIDPKGKEHTFVSSIKGYVPLKPHNQEDSYDPIFSIITYENKDKTYPNLSAEEKLDNPSMSDILLNQTEAFLNKEAAKKSSETDKMDNIKMFHSIRKIINNSLGTKQIDAVPDYTNIYRQYEGKWPQEFFMLIGYGMEGYRKFNTFYQLINNKKAIAYIQKRQDITINMLHDLTKYSIELDDLKFLLPDKEKLNIFAQLSTLGFINELKEKNNESLPLSLKITDTNIVLLGDENEKNMVGIISIIPEERKLRFTFDYNHPVPHIAKSFKHIKALLADSFEQYGWDLYFEGDREYHVYESPNIQYRIHEPIYIEGTSFKLVPYIGEINRYNIQLNNVSVGAIHFDINQQGQWTYNPEISRFFMEEEDKITLLNWAKELSQKTSPQDLEIKNTDNFQGFPLEIKTSDPQYQDFLNGLGSIMEQRIEEKKEIGKWFNYYNNFYLREAILDFIGYGEPRSLSSKECQQRNKTAEQYLEKIYQHPEVQSAFKKYLRDYTVQITDMDRNAPLFMTAANFLAGRPLADKEVADLKILNDNAYLSEHPWFGNTKVANRYSPYLIMPHTKKDRIKVLVVGAAEKYGANQKTQYLRDIIKQLQPAGQEIEILATDIDYQDEVYTYDKETDSFIKKKAFDFDKNGDYTDPDSGIRFKNVVHEKDNIIESADVYDSSEKFDVIICARVAIQFFRVPDLLNNLVSNMKEQLNDQGLLLYDTPDTDRAQIFFRNGDQVALVGTTPFRDNVQYFNDLNIYRKSLGFNSDLLEEAYTIALQKGDTNSRLLSKRIIINLLSEVVKDQHILTAVLLKDIEITTPLVSRAVQNMINDHSLRLAGNQLDYDRIARIANSNDAYKNMIFHKRNCIRNTDLGNKTFTSDTSMWKGLDISINFGKVGKKYAIEIAGPDKTIYLIEDQ